jgi:hypothetical protein
MINIIGSGCILAELGRLDEAEKMYQRALAGYEKAWDRSVHHHSTRSTTWACSTRTWDGLIT